ncbi:MAG: hypothetical protein PHP03_03270 [Candidatus Pacebacteria bacterium]|nr:hypothetical protein [Candidatus Paceibacterota bacterium]
MIYIKQISNAYQDTTLEILTLDPKSLKTPQIISAAPRYMNANIRISQNTFA